MQNKIAKKNISKPKKNKEIFKPNGIKIIKKEKKILKTKTNPNKPSNFSIKHTTGLSTASSSGTSPGCGRKACQGTSVAYCSGFLLYCRNGLRI